MLVGYARVSSKSQATDNQIKQLTGFGCQKVYEEQFTGVSSDRPELNRVLKYVREGDSLVVTKLDRLARSATDLGVIARALEAQGVDLVVVDQKIDTSTPSGKLMFTMIGAFAEFERDLIRERCKEGIDKAKERGVKFGRPAKLGAQEIKSLKEEFESGTIGKSELARKYGVSRASLYRLVAIKEAL